MKLIQKRRRREGKTDYKARKNILKPGKARAVFRKTNRYIICQIIESIGAQDKALVSANSKELLKYEWPKERSGSLKSLPASYLSGYILGSRAVSSGINNAILDMGLNRSIPKSRVYAFVKGAIESGLNIPCSEKMLPENNRIEGINMKKDIKAVIDRAKAKFMAEKITDKKIVDKLNDGRGERENKTH